MAVSKLSLADDDYEDDFDEPLYRGGHWAWVDDRLDYVSSLPCKVKSAVLQPLQISGKMTFKAELDVLEQRRFQRRYQRKYNMDSDVVTLQDIKDLVFYTAPQQIVNVMLVNALHTTTAERFLRALIFYCEYYLQILDKMKQRTMERQSKVRTKNSEKIEKEYQENLTDLRLLVGKEYFAMILGASDFKKFHHLGRNQNMHSMIKRDRFFYEALIAFSCQIVFVALNRQNHTLLNVEINRLFRSKKYNVTERCFGFDQSKSMTDAERRTMLGPCAQRPNACSINAHTPMSDEFGCVPDIDYKIIGLGIIQYDDLNNRLKYFKYIISMPESRFSELNITLGIIGLPRRQFDIMLKRIPEHFDNISADRSACLLRRSSRTSNLSRKSLVSIKSGKLDKVKDEEERVINLPPKAVAEVLPDVFPSKPAEPLRVDKTQQKKWVLRTLVYHKRLAGHRTPLK